MNSTLNYKKVVQIWLLIGVVMVFVQIILGGVTRLTGSGLSITKWEITTGTVPPLNGDEWEEEFLLYQGTPQYEKINQGMSLREFKFIYFWEFTHRLWARTMGFVFLFPFLFFMYKKWIDSRLLKRLLIVVAMAMLVASFGWIMVASGLIDRPWVNAYKLTIHLNLGLLLYAMLFSTYIFSLDPGRRAIKSNRLYKLLRIITVFLVLQLLLGGLMSGMKAGLYYPTWPDMSGQFIPGVLFGVENWSVDSFIHYDVNALAPALVQFLHRSLAYIVFGLIIWFSYRVSKSNLARWYRQGSIVLVSVTLIQVVLGILTVLQCIGGIPLFEGVLHQAGAILLITALLYMMRGTIKEST